MGRTYSFIISFLLLPVITFGQYRSDSLYGLRISADLSRIAVHYAQPSRTDIDLGADMQVADKWFAVAQVGWNKTNINNDSIFASSSSGTFGRIGFDYNILKPEYQHESNMVYVGMRYGRAFMKQEIPHYELVDDYWGNIEGSVPKHTLSPDWIELTAGIKVEVLKNFFLGWGIHERILIRRKYGALYRPQVIPGFGKSANNSVFDVNYTVSYKFPLFRAKEIKPLRKSLFKASPAAVDTTKKPLTVPAKQP